MHLLTNRTLLSRGSRSVHFRICSAGCHFCRASFGVSGRLSPSAFAIFSPGRYAAVLPMPWPCFRSANTVRVGHDGESSPIDVLVKPFDAKCSCEYRCSTSFRVREAKAIVPVREIVLRMVKHQPPL